MYKIIAINLQNEEIREDIFPLEIKLKDCSTEGQYVEHLKVYAELNLFGIKYTNCYHTAVSLEPGEGVPFLEKTAESVVHYLNETGVRNRFYDTQSQKLGIPEYAVKYFDYSKNKIETETGKSIPRRMMVKDFSKICINYLSHMENYHLFSYGNNSQIQSFSFFEHWGKRLLGMKNMQFDVGMAKKLDQFIKYKDSMKMNFLFDLDKRRRMVTVEKLNYVKPQMIQLMKDKIAGLNLVLDMHVSRTKLVKTDTYRVINPVTLTPYNKGMKVSISEEEKCCEFNEAIRDKALLEDFIVNFDQICQNIPNDLITLYERNEAKLVSSLYKEIYCNGIDLDFYFQRGKNCTLEGKALSDIFDYRVYKRELEENEPKVMTKYGGFSLEPGVKGVSFIQIMYTELFFQSDYGADKKNICMTSMLLAEALLTADRKFTLKKDIKKFMKLFRGLSVRSTKLQFEFSRMIERLKAEPTVQPAYCFALIEKMDLDRAYSAKYRCLRILDDPDDRYGHFTSMYSRSNYLDIEKFLKGLEISYPLAIIREKEEEKLWEETQRKLYQEAQEKKAAEAKKKREKNGDTSSFGSYSGSSSSSSYSGWSNYRSDTYVGDVTDYSALGTQRMYEERAREKDRQDEWARQELRDRVYGSYN
jgi:hypothetical protein